MAGVTAHGATLTFQGLRALVTGLSVESPVAEFADMTDINDGPTIVRLVPTGAWSGGRVTVECLATFNPISIVKRTGNLSFVSDGFSYSSQAAVESATIDAKMGDVVRCSIRFRTTDHF